MPDHLIHIKFTKADQEKPLPGEVLSLPITSKNPAWVNALEAILKKETITTESISPELGRLSEPETSNLEKLSSAVHTRIEKHIGLVAAVNLTAGIQQHPIPDTIKVIVVTPTNDAPTTQEISFKPPQWRKFYTFCTELLQQHKELHELDLEDPFKSLGSLKKRRNPTQKTDMERITTATLPTTGDDGMLTSTTTYRGGGGAGVTRISPSKTEQQSSQKQSPQQQTKRTSDEPIKKELVTRTLWPDDDSDPSSTRTRRRRHNQTKDDATRVDGPAPAPTPAPTPTPAPAGQQEAQQPVTQRTTPTRTPTQKSRRTTAITAGATQENTEKPSQTIILDALTCAGFVGTFLTGGAASWMLFNASSAAIAASTSSTLGTLILANPAIPTLIALFGLLALAAVAIILARHPRVRRCMGPLSHCRLHLTKSPSQSVVNPK